MKAVQVLGPGGREQIAVRDIRRPEPAKGQVLVRVHAASINPLDWKVRRSAVRIIYGLRFPFIPGFDFAGVVEAVGSNVRRLKPGDAVYGLTVHGGSHAEYVASDESAVALKPGGLTFTEAAAMPAAGLTALQAIQARAKVQRGHRVLINGASGGVGSFAAQIATAFGADVTAVTSSRNLEFVFGLGATQAVDYISEDFTKLADRFEVVFDVVPNRSFPECAPVLTRDGIYLTTLPGVGPYAWRLATQISRPFGYRRRCWWVMLKPDVEGLATLGQMADDRRLKPAVSQILPLNEAAAAHDLIETGHARGKIVIDLMR